MLLGSWPSAAEVSRVTAELQQAACTRGEPLAVAVDQEGGLVRRFPWAAPTVAPAQHLRARLAESEARIHALKAWLAAAGGPSCG